MGLMLITVMHLRVLHKILVNFFISLAAVNCSRWTPSVEVLSDWIPQNHHINYVRLITRANVVKWLMFLDYIMQRVFTAVRLHE